MELLFEKMQLAHWIERFKVGLMLQNLILIKHVRCDQLTEIIRLHLIKAHRDGGSDQFWRCMRDIPRLVTVLQNITSLSHSSMQNELEKEMSNIFKEVSLDYPFWISQISKWLDIDSIWQLDTVEPKQFDMFVGKSDDLILKQLTVHGKTVGLNREANGSFGQETLVIPSLFTLSLGKLQIITFHNSGK